MKFQDFLKYNPTNFMFVDPSINNTGYAVYRCSVDLVDKETVHLKLLKYGLLRFPCEYERNNDVRIADFFHPLMALCDEFKVRRCYVEEPGETIYGAKKMTKDGIIARARSVALTMATCHGIIAHIKQKHHCWTFLPADWQPPHQRRKKPSKEWSLDHANLVLKQQGFPSTLQTKADENIADAINFGYVILKKYESGLFTF